MLNEEQVVEPDQLIQRKRGLLSGKTSIQQENHLIERKGQGELTQSCEQQFSPCSPSDSLVEFGSVSETWRSSVVFSILGLLIFAVYFTGMLIAASLGKTMISIGLLVGFAYPMLRYIFVMYPSFFGRDFSSSDCRRLSYTNCFFGFLFGLHWNRCLGRERQDKSNIVAAVSILFCATLVVAGFAIAHLA